MASAKQFLLMKLYFELEKLSKEIMKNRGKHGISYNKHRIKGKCFGWSQLRMTKKFQKFDKIK